MCKDPALTYLRKYGYCVVRLPTTQLRPMDVLGRDGDTPTYLGSIAKLCEDAPPIPKAKSDTVTEIEGKSTGTFTLDAGLRILDGLIAGFGAITGSARTGYGKVKYLRFAFDAPIVRSIDLGAIGDWLGEAKPSFKNVVATHFLTDPDPDVSALIVHSVLLSKEITVTALDDVRQEVGVDVSALRATTSGALKIEHAARSGNQVRYVGDKLLTFGFACRRIVYEEQRWAIPNLHRKDTPYAGIGAEGADEDLGEELLDVNYSAEGGTL